MKLSCAECGGLLVCDLCSSEIDTTEDVLSCDVHECGPLFCARCQSGELRIEDAP